MVRMHGIVDVELIPIFLDLHAWAVVFWGGKKLVPRVEKTTLVHWRVGMRSKLEIDNGCICIVACHGFDRYLCVFIWSL